MIKKTIFIILFILIAIPYFAFADDSNDEDEIEGDEKLACEAVLCLSSGERPDECSPSLERYFSIKKKKWKDTVKSRKKFLKKCPESESSNDSEMESLVNVIGEGAGLCSAEELNKRGKWVLSNKRVSGSFCRNRDQNINTGNYIENYNLVTWGGGDEAVPETECRQQIRYWVVDQTIPSYCKPYMDHSYTDFNTRLERGNNPWETRWVD